MCFMLSFGEALLTTREQFESKRSNKIHKPPLEADVRVQGWSRLSEKSKKRSVPQTIVGIRRCAECKSGCAVAEENVVLLSGAGQGTGDSQATGESKNVRNMKPAGHWREPPAGHSQEFFHAKFGNEGEVMKTT